MFSLESPQRGDSNEYTQYTIFQFERKNLPKLPQICNYGICSKGLKNEFETAVVNEPSVFEPLKFYCIFFQLYSLIFKLSKYPNHKSDFVSHLNIDNSEISDPKTEV